MVGIKKVGLKDAWQVTQIMFWVVPERKLVTGWGERRHDHMCLAAVTADSHTARAYVGLPTHSAEQGRRGADRCEALQPASKWSSWLSYVTK